MLSQTIMHKIFPVLPDIVVEQYGSETLVKTNPTLFGQFMGRFQDLHFQLNGHSNYVRNFDEILTEIGMEVEELKSSLYLSVEAYYQIPVQTRENVLRECHEWNNLFTNYLYDNDYNAFKEEVRSITRRALLTDRLANHHLFLGGRNELVDYFKGRYEEIGYINYGLQKIVNHEMGHFDAYQRAARAIGREDLNPWLGVLFSIGEKSFDMSYCESFFTREIREDRISEREFNIYRKIAFKQPPEPSDGDKSMTVLVQ